MRISRSQAVFFIKKQNPNSDLQFAKILKSQTLKETPTTLTSGKSVQPSTSKKTQNDPQDKTTLRKSLSTNQKETKDKTNAQQKGYPIHINLKTQTIAKRHERRSRSKEKRADKSRSSRSNQENSRSHDSIKRNYDGCRRRTR